MFRKTFIFDDKDSGVSEDNASFVSKHGAKIATAGVIAAGAIALNKIQKREDDQTLTIISEVDDPASAHGDNFRGTVKQINIGLNLNFGSLVQFAKKIGDNINSRQRGHIVNNVIESQTPQEGETNA
jgi:hypothetical protein